MRVLLSGGAGFIGSHVYDRLVKDGHEVLVIDNLATGRLDNLPTSGKIIIEDISGTSWQQQAHAFDPEAFIHLAAQVSVGRSVSDASQDAMTNINGTIKVLDFCRTVGVRKVVLASSAAVYGQPVSLPINEDHPIGPLSPYGVSKFAAEQYFRLYGHLWAIPYVVLRFSNVYGPRQIPDGESGVVAIFVDALARGEPVVIHGDGSQVRDFIYVEDVAHAVIKSLSVEQSHILNIGTGKSTSIMDLLMILDKKLGRKTTPIHASLREGDIPKSYFDIERAKEVLAWGPHVTFDEGISRTILWELERTRRELVAASVEG